MALRIVLTAEQIIKIFVRGNHMSVLIVRKVSNTTPDPRGAHPRPSKKSAEKDIWC